MTTTKNPALTPTEQHTNDEAEGNDPAAFPYVSADVENALRVARSATLSAFFDLFPVLRNLFTTDVDGVILPFIESEDANITGPGHQDKAAFATLINHYDLVTSGEDRPADELWTADDISHRWITIDADGKHFVVDGVTADTEGALPVTTLWYAR